MVRTDLPEAERVRRKQFLDETNAAYGRMKQNPEEWNEFLNEREEFERASLEDFNDDPLEEGECIARGKH